MKDCVMMCSGFEQRHSMFQKSPYVRARKRVWSNPSSARRPAQNAPSRTRNVRWVRILGDDAAMRRGVLTLFWTTSI